MCKTLAAKVNIVLRDILRHIFRVHFCSFQVDMLQFKFSFKVYFWPPSSAVSFCAKTCFPFVTSYISLPSFVDHWHNQFCSGSYWQETDLKNIWQGFVFIIAIFWATKSNRTRQVYFALGHTFAQWQFIGYLPSHIDHWLAPICIRSWWQVTSSKWVWARLSFSQNQFPWRQN